MKILKIALLAMPLLCVGCLAPNTGFVRVDKNTAQDAGIIVLNFTDNPIFANIYYTPMKENFDPQKLNITLKRAILSTSDDFFDFYNFNWQMMEFNSSKWQPQKFQRLYRDAIVVRHEPGHIKLLSIDDIGTYEFSYKD